MPVYRIYKLREPRRNHFRWAPHISGVADVRPKDYVEAGSLEAATPYSVWSQLRDVGNPLEVGDLLEPADGGLRIYKYVGFEEARWVLSEVETGIESLPAASGTM